MFEEVKEEDLGRRIEEKRREAEVFFLLNQKRKGISGMWKTKRFFYIGTRGDGRDDRVRKGGKKEGFYWKRMQKRIRQIKVFVSSEEKQGY